MKYATFSATLVDRLRNGDSANHEAANAIEQLQTVLKTLLAPTSMSNELMTVGDIRASLARHTDDVPVKLMMDECPDDIVLRFNGFDKVVLGDGVAIVHVAALELDDERESELGYVENDEVDLEDWDEFDGELELDSSLDDEWNGL